MMKTMRSYLSAGIALLCLGLALTMLSMSVAPRDTFAATQNYAGVPLVTMPLHFASFTASASSVAAVKVPAKMKLIGMSTKARSASGVSDTLTLNLRAGSTAIISPLAASSAAVTEATISTSTIADETVLYVDTAVNSGGAWYDIDVLLTLIPI